MKRETVQRLKSALWFIVKLNILAIPLYLIVQLGLSVPEFQQIWAQALGQSLKSFGYQVTVDGYHLIVRDGYDFRQIELSWDSTGWKSMYAIVALTLASGIGTLRNKLRFIAFGIPLMAFINFARIDSTILFSLAFGFESFEFIHVFLWGFLMVILVLCVWYFLYVRPKR